MKISPCFTHRQGILGVYDFLLSDESNRSYIQNCPGSFRMAVNGCFMDGCALFLYFWTVEQKTPISFLGELTL